MTSERLTDQIFSPSVKTYRNWQVLNGSTMTRTRKQANEIKLPIEETLLEYLNSISEKELKRLADQVRPFLFNEDDIELIIKAPLYGKTFLDNYNEALSYNSARKLDIGSIR